MTYARLSFNLVSFMNINKCGLEVLASDSNLKVNWDVRFVHIENMNKIFE